MAIILAAFRANPTDGTELLECPWAGGDEIGQNLVGKDIRVGDGSYEGLLRPIRAQGQFQRGFQVRIWNRIHMRNDW